MPINTAVQKNNTVVGYTAAATHAAAYSTAPGATAGTEITGGTPAYARKVTAWSAASNGVQSTVNTFDIPSGATVAGLGLHNALTVGTYLDGAAVTSQAFASQGTYQGTQTITIT